jgi:hypothetical protein
VNVRVAEGYEDVLEEDLVGVRVLCLERPTKDKKALGKLLRKREQLESVVFSGGKRMEVCGLPKGWMLDELDVKHAAVGGVTDAVGKFLILRRSKSGHKDGGKLVLTPRPSRDAREVLKMARPGVKLTGLNDLPFRVRVREAAPDAVLSLGCFQQGKESEKGMKDSLCDGFADVTLPGRARNAVDHGKGSQIQKQKNPMFLHGNTRG